MNKRTRQYIKVYRQHYGEIPKDEYGISYDIHHIDGDYTNNDPSNLVALSVREHYDVHRKQEEWGAAWAISKRFGFTSEERAESTRQMNLYNAEQGLHWSQISSKNGTHPFQSLEFQKYMAEQAKLAGNRSVDRIWNCEVCRKTGKGMSNYYRYHGENCGKCSKMKRKIWVNDGAISKMIDVDYLSDYYMKGWVLGRGSAEITPRRKNANGTSGSLTQYVKKTTNPYRKESS